MSGRVSQEITLLKRKYPRLNYHEENSWVVIPNYELPADRFNMEMTDLHFLIPIGYPNTAPDNFFVNQNLRLSDNQMPPAFSANPNSNTGQAKAPGNWGWFSWHPDTWRASSEITKGDNLASFVRSIGTRLRGG
ncbi:MAG: hypothetical protein IH840_02765 [Candidatus Heimdallarchaeota archaeon]|nr:hypothetical protein [Candidatus Heimdallarchaeota archaeon]